MTTSSVRNTYSNSFSLDAFLACRRLLLEGSSRLFLFLHLLPPTLELEELKWYALARFSADLIFPAVIKSREPVSQAYLEICEYIQTPKDTWILSRRKKKRREKLTVCHTHKSTQMLDFENYSVSRDCGTWMLEQIREIWGRQRKCREKTSSTSVDVGTSFSHGQHYCPSSCNHDRRGGVTSFTNEGKE